MNTSPTTSRIFLVHGIFMRGYVMQYMAHQLKKLGYTVHVFSYQSTQSDLQNNAALFVDFIKANSQAGDTCHFVGHSLGGLLIRLAYEITPSCFTGHIVTLGTPHNGSEVAHRVAKDLYFNLLGEAFEGALDGTLPIWQGGIPLGSLAGTKEIGLSWVVGTLESPNDGTVTVAETQLFKQSDHIALPLSHTMLVYSLRVVAQTHYFLREGRFNHDTAGKS